MSCPNQIQQSDYLRQVNNLSGVVELILMQHMRQASNDHARNLEFYSCQRINDVDRVKRAGFEQCPTDCIQAHDVHQ